MDTIQLRNRIYQSLLGLITEEGINASGKDEIYGCIFGRDSAITILKILKVLSNPSIQDQIDVAYLTDVCRRSLVTLTALQGQERNIESGEEPGKFIHEYRKEKYDHLLTLERPWFVYPDNKLRNYDSLDSTPLALIAIYKFYELTNDSVFLLTALPAVEKGLYWILNHADKDNDFLVEYEFPKDRKYGGLVVQSWTDSHESLRQSDGKFPLYPIAPVEVQGYTWLALKLWSNFYATTDMKPRKKKLLEKMRNYTQKMKTEFNKRFLFQDGKYTFPSQALDGEKNQIRTITGNPLLLLWASYGQGDQIESILEDRYVDDLVQRSFEYDLFEADAGIRTMSTLSPTYNPREDSYHNGSFWPKLNGMAHEGLMKWQYIQEADKLKVATLAPIVHFGTPIELYTKDQNGLYVEFRGPTGQTGCREQAWSAAVALDLLTDILPSESF